MVRDMVANFVYRLLERGFDPRRVGPDAWESRCPGHNSTDHALSITRDAVYGVNLHCRSSHNCRYGLIRRALVLIGPDRETPEEVLRRLSAMEIEPSSFREEIDQTRAPADSTHAIAGGDAASASGDECDDHARGQERTAVDPSALDEPGPDASLAPPSVIAFSSDSITEGHIKRSALRILLRLSACAQFFRSADGRFFAQVPVGDRLEIFGLRSAAFRDWLVDGYVNSQPEAPSDWAVRRATSVLEARARFQTRVPEIFVRVGRNSIGDDDAYFLDLGDPSGAAIEIRAAGWSVVDRPGVHFRRPHGQLPLPVPSRDGSIELLRRYVNVSDAGFTLLVAWLTAALRPVGPYPILVLTGEQGSGKSTLARILRFLIDPQACPLLVEPRSARDLMVTALSGWLLAYDNLSAVPTWLSDCLCQLVYGGGFAGRELFTNDERSIIHAQRPVILNGIDDFVRRGDLRDRCVFLELSSIARARRRTEDEFWKAFHADCPRILGGVLDAIAGALAALPAIQVESLPRMADHAKWGEAIGRSLGWKPLQFLLAYDGNVRDAGLEMLQDSVAGLALLGMAEEFTAGWSGSPSELHGLVTKAVGREIAASAPWPKTPRNFSLELRRLVPQLRMHGLAIEFQRGNRGRVITLTADPSAAADQSLGA